MAASWIATIVVIAFLIFFACWGFRKGFLRIILSTLSLLITIVAASLLLPWFSGVIADSFIGRSVDEKISSLIEEKVDDPLVNSVESVQQTVIDGLPLPAFIRNDISKKNTPADYLSLKVTDFTDYLKTRLIDLADRTIAFLILAIVIFLIIRILLKLSGMINKVPLIGGVNRFFGGIFGLLEGLLFLWVICLLIMLFSGTSFGMKIVEVINSNAFLKLIYDNNGIILGGSLLVRSFL